jgi:hypothetical protein
MYSTLVKIFDAFMLTIAWTIIAILVVLGIISAVEILSAGGWHAAHAFLRVVQP